VKTDHFHFIIYLLYFTDHPQSGMAYNFGPVNESVCLYVCMYVRR